METVEQSSVTGLTRKQVKRLLPGRKLDKLIALEVMKYSLYHYDKDVAANCYFMLLDREGDPVKFYPHYRDGEHATLELAWDDCPQFSTNLEAAWQVYAWLQKQRFSIGGHVEIGSNSHSLAVGEPCYWIGPSYSAATCLVPLCPMRYA